MKYMLLVCHDEQAWGKVGEARDLDEAIGIAARIPGARWGTVEVRPVKDIAGLPEP